MVRYIHSKEDMIAVTQELEAGVEINIQDFNILMALSLDDHSAAFSKLVCALMNKPTLERLYVHSGKCISFENATCISNLLDTNINPLGRLREIELAHCEVTDEHVVEICKGLNNNKFLVELAFSRNTIGDSGAISLGKVLATIKSLELLNLQANKINEAGAKAIAEGIMERQYPSHSNIARHFSTQPCKEFALNLDYNDEINSLGAKAFASLLHKQHSALSPLVSLTKLDLTFCAIGDEGAVAIAESLKSHKTDVGLKELCLYGNGIGNAGAIAFANALKENKVMTELDLRNNKIQLDGGIALCRTFEDYNDTLQTFSLRRNPCSNEVWKDDVTINNYCNRYLRIRKPNHKDVSEKKRMYCQLVKTNKILNFVSYYGIDKSTNKV